MRIGSSAALALSLVVGLGGAATACPEGAQDRPTVRWANSWEEAVEEATARNVPIFVTFHQDG